MTSIVRRALRDSRGFTLAELLVAMALTGVVLGGALVALQVGTTTSEIATGRTEAQANGRAALERLAGHEF